MQSTKMHMIALVVCFSPVVGMDTAYTVQMPWVCHVTVTRDMAVTVSGWPRPQQKRSRHTSIFTHIDSRIHCDERL